MSTKYPGWEGTLVRHEVTIINSTQDASGNWFAELEMAIWIVYFFSTG